MNKWIVTSSNLEKSFDCFSDAVVFFRGVIINYIKTNKDIFVHNCMPFQPGAFFFYKFNDGVITDEEIVIEYRITNLLNTFECSEKSLNEFVNNALNKSIKYRGIIDKIEEELIINADKSQDEIKLEIIDNDLHEDGDNTYLYTNAFIFNDEHKEYYFNSHQVINTSDKPENLGKSVDLIISLKYEQLTML